MKILVKIICICLTLTLISCGVGSKKDTSENNRSDRYVILTGKVNGFDINSFAENPFDDNVEVPSYLSDDLTFLNSGQYSSFIRSDKIISSGNGDYPAYVFVGPLYTLQYSSIGAGGDKRKMLRTILRIDKIGTKLKYGISIGMDIDDVKKLLPHEAIGQYKDSKSKYYFILGEELAIHFEEKNKKLFAVEIQVGD